MIEKVMRTVKSSNKKMGRNITIGAVVGILLSCSAVMGAEGDYLWIKNDGGEIKFSTVDDDKGGEWKEENPYHAENSWKGNTYINNMTLYGIENGMNPQSGRLDGYGVKLSGDLEKVKFINNGSILGTGNFGGQGIYNDSGSNIGNIANQGLILGKGLHAYAYGIYNDSGSSIGTIINSGVILGIGIDSMFYSGIYNLSRSNIESIINTGIISGAGNISGIGIFNDNDVGIGSSSIGSITNNGLIIGTSSYEGYGIKNWSSNIGSSIESTVNNGLIIGTGNSAGYGIFNLNNNIESIINIGTIYGSTNAICNYYVGIINNTYNYGLLVSNGGSVVQNTGGTVDFIKSYGLAFKVDGNKYILDEKYSGKFGEIYGNTDVVIGYEKKENGNFDFDKPITEKYTIINAKEDKSGSDVTRTKSLVLKNGILFHDDFENSGIKDYSLDKKYILNGITDTLKIVGMHNKLNNSVINAYETAVVMNKNKSMLTLDNTVVNGGMKADTTTVNITGNENNFTVKGDSVINTKDKGVAIKVTGDNNAVVLSGNAIVNGKMEATGKDNILALNGTAENGMNILHDITGFTNMNIDNNVTFFEDTKVTGTDTVTVEGTGVLSLRLKKSDVSFYNTIPTTTHAFSGRDGKHEMTIKGSSLDEAGTLNFITNGIGREILVDMKNITLENMKINTSSIIDTAKFEGDFIHLGAGSDLGGIVNPKEVKRYNQLNSIYRSIYSSTDENLDGLRDVLNITYIGKNYDYNNITDKEQLANLLGYLNDIYARTPYSYSSELSRRSVEMFRDIVTGNEFRPNLNNWLVMGGLTHADGGTKDTYYGKNYYKIDSGSSSTNADMKLTGAYMLAKYGYSENTSLGLTLGGNKSEAKLDMSKVKGNSGYLGAFVENYRGNLTLKVGAGVQYSEYDADRRTIGGHSYNDKYSDMTYDIYLNGRYSNPIGDNLFLEPYGTLSYTYTKQDGANEGNKTLAIETDSKSFDYTVGKIGVDLKKIIPHSAGKSTLSAGVSYTKIFDGADEEHITGRFKGGSDFDILVAHKNQHSIGLNAKYALELESGILFDVKGTYSVERDSHNGSGKNRTKGEWIVGTGVGYKF